MVTETNIYTMIQMVMGLAMIVIAGGLIFTGMYIEILPIKLVVMTALIAIAAKYFIDGMMNIMNALSENV